LNYPDQEKLRLTPRQIAVRRYFTPTPKFPVRKLVGPGIATVFGLLLFAAGSVGLFIGLVVIAIALFRAVPRIQRYQRACAFADPKPTDHQMDLWLAEAYDPIVENGFNRLDIVQSDLVNTDMRPLIVVGFPKEIPASTSARQEWRPGDPRLGFRLARGLDGKVRASHYDILVVYLTKWRLCTYQCVLEMETGNVIMDGTREFLYRDVLSVATESSREKVEAPVDHAQRAPGAGPKTAGAAKEQQRAALEITSSQWFRLRVASDEIAVRVALFDISAYGEGTHVDMAIRQIRGRLRDYSELREDGSGAFDDLRAAQRRRQPF
jgi:hypothetical protein